MMQYGEGDWEPTIEPGAPQVAERTADGDRLVGMAMPTEEGRLAPIVRPLEAPRIPQPRGTQQQIERVIVRHSDEVDKLFGALAAAQGAFGDIEKSLTATVESRRTGGKFTYDYETLADVLAATRPALSANGIAFMQFPFPGATSITIRTMLGHSSGQWIYNDLSATLGVADPQAVGGGISYLRRYAAKSILGVSAQQDDNDGSAASGQREAPKPAQRKSQQAERQADPPQARQQPADPARQPAPAAQAPAPAKADVNVGLVAELGERNGAHYVALDTGFVAATKDPMLVAHLVSARRDRVRVRLDFRPPRDAKYAPTLTGVTPA